jgi:hypothetical protein
MDLWAWVNSLEERLRAEGHVRLADLVERLPNEVVNDRHERVDALVAEARGLAKAIEEPWLEVFLRHWWLQSRILHRMDGSALGEAVSLVELAHREETRACPQAVCAVQDLAAGYGIVDGAGYAQERLDVALETLARIDTSWSCFTCIATEYASALHDRGEHAATLAFLDEKAAVLLADGRGDDLGGLARSRIDALRGIGRYEEALAAVAEDEARGRDDEHHRLWRRLDRARLIVGLGRTDEAREALPDPSEVRSTPLFYAAWCDAAVGLVEAGALPNDARFGATLQGFLERLERQEVGRTTLELAQTQGFLALARGAPHVARRALATMERASSRLHRPLDALDRIAKLRAAITAAPSVADVEVPETPALVLGSLSAPDARDAEKDLVLLEAAHARFPDDVEVALCLSECQLEGGFLREAEAVLEAFHRRTGNDDAVIRLGSLLISRPDELATVVDRHRAMATTDGSGAIGDWLLARAAQSRADWKACLQHLDAVLLARPEAMNARGMYAEVARRMGDHATALQKLDEVVARTPDGGPADWDRMVVATILGDFERVRESAKRVGIALQGEGPIEERMGMCRIRFEDEGRARWALRISPVTARIVDVAAPPSPQHFGDVVVFDATPLEPTPATAEERARHRPTFPWVATLTPGNHRTYVFDGVHPGDDVVEALEGAATTLGCTLQALNGDDYRVTGERGLYGAVALPEGASEAALCTALAAVIGERKVTFAELARAAGDTELADRHAALAAELEL